MMFSARIFLCNPFFAGKVACSARLFRSRGLSFGVVFSRLQSMASCWSKDLRKVWISGLVTWGFARNWLSHKPETLNHQWKTSTKMEVELWPREEKRCDVLGSMSVEWWVKLTDGNPKPTPIKATRKTHKSPDFIANRVPYKALLSQTPWFVEMFGLINLPSICKKPLLSFFSCFRFPSLNSGHFFPWHGPIKPVAEAAALLSGNRLLVGVVGTASAASCQGASRGWIRWMLWFGCYKFSFHFGRSSHCCRSRCHGISSTNIWRWKLRRLACQVIRFIRFVRILERWT